MVTVYLAGAAVGAANGIVAAALSAGGPGQWGGWAASALKRGKTRAAALASLGLGIGLGLYQAWLFGQLNGDFWGLLILSGYLLCASLTDVASREIPVGASLCYAAVLALQALLSGWPVLVNSLLGAALGAAVMGLPHLLRPAAIGRGDVLLLAVCGLGCGFPGVLYVLSRGLIALVVVSLVQLARKKANIHTQMPLAPFLLFGAMI